MSGKVQKRSTRQLTAIYETLQDDHSHPTADEIFLRVRESLPRISLGTVYRNLQRLVAEGKLRLVLSGGRVARYDPMVAEHDHFICRRCERVIDVVLESDCQVNLTALREQGFTIASQSLAIHGLCQQCNLQLPQKFQDKAGADQRERRPQGRSYLASRKEKRIREERS